jgi:hypothetical protein
MKRRDRNVLLRRVDGYRASTKSSKTLYAVYNSGTHKKENIRREKKTSERIPPPQPTSRTSNPCNARCDPRVRAHSSPRSSRPTSSTLSRTNCTRCGFILCSRPNSPRSSHHSAERREKCAISDAFTVDVVDVVDDDDDASRWICRRIRRGGALCWSVRSAAAVEKWGGVLSEERHVNMVRRK